MNRRLSVLAFAAFFAAVVVVPVATFGGDLTMRNIAHRGMWDDSVPQNTVEAIKRAYDSGATWVETDFHHTKAGQMVCIHAGKELKKYIRKCKDAGIEVFCPGCSSTVGVMTPADAEAVRAAGLEFRMFGVNSLENLRQAKALGVTGFTCNYWHKAFEWAAEIGGVTLLK